MRTTLYRGGIVHTPDHPGASALVLGDDAQLARLRDAEGAESHPDRVGPVRLVGQRLALASNVKLMAFLCFGFAGIVGLALVALSLSLIHISEPTRPY